MKETLRLIGKYIPEPYTIKLNEKEVLTTYNILNDKEENIGFIKLMSSGDLKSYTYTGNVFKHTKHLLTEEAILEKTKMFLKSFVKDSTLTVTSVFTYSNRYQINYEKKDANYNLCIPDTGVEIILNLTGNIISFDKKDEEYEVIYPDKVITSEEAKALYLKGFNLDLKVNKPEKHNHYKLVYRITKAVEYVYASGKEIDMKVIKQHLKSLERFTTSSTNIFRILGLDGNYSKIGKKNKKDCRIELWSKQSKKSLNHLDYDINEPQQGVIKYRINKHTNQIVQICDGDLFSEDQNEDILSKKAFDRAQDLLFTVYPEANDLFDVIDSVGDSEDEVDQKYEPNYIFYFNRVHDSIEVENQIACIGVGKYTGMINKFRAPTVTEKELAHINVFAKVSETEAKKLYGDIIKMSLSFMKKADEHENLIYELVYLPTILHNQSVINLIDAHKGTFYEA